MHIPEFLLQIGGCGIYCDRWLECYHSYKTHREPNISAIKKHFKAWHEVCSAVCECLLWLHLQGRCKSRKENRDMRTVNLGTGVFKKRMIKRPRNLTGTPSSCSPCPASCLRNQHSSCDQPLPTHRADPGQVWPKTYIEGPLWEDEFLLNRILAIVWNNDHVRRITGGSLVGLGRAYARWVSGFKASLAWPWQS